MAVERPWVTPEDVKNYTSYEEVLKRPDEKLAFDITMAEQKIIYITNNRFEDYEEIPAPVKLAIIKVAEAYSKNYIESSKKNIKSETFDDYSYTAESSTIDLNSLDLEVLLADYIITDGIGRVVMRLRSL